MADIILNEEQTACISDDLEVLSRLLDAVDKYLYNPGARTYTPGHFNPENLDDLRDAFIAVWDRPGDDARDVLAKAKEVAYAEEAYLVESSHN